MNPARVSHWYAGIIIHHNNYRGNNLTSVQFCALAGAKLNSLDSSDIIKMKRKKQSAQTQGCRAPRVQFSFIKLYLYFLSLRALQRVLTPEEAALAEKKESLPFDRTKPGAGPGSRGTTPFYGSGNKLSTPLQSIFLVTDWSSHRSSQLLFLRSLFQSSKTSVFFNSALKKWECHRGASWWGSGVGKNESQGLWVNTVHICRDMVNTEAII